jgi:hypothetical protein
VGSRLMGVVHVHCPYGGPVKNGRTNEGIPKGGANGPGNEGIPTGGANGPGEKGRTNVLKGGANGPGENGLNTCDNGVHGMPPEISV